MNQGWIDFATAPSAGGPASSGPTASDIRAAHAAKAQRGTGTGKGKRCVKGKSCSAACIDPNEFCLVELPAPVSDAISKVSRYLQGRVEAGAITPEEAKGHKERLFRPDENRKPQIETAKAQEIVSALDGLKAAFTKDGKLEEQGYNNALNRVFDVVAPGVATPRTKNTPLTPAEIEGLKKNEKLIKEFSDLQKEVIQRNKDKNPISAEELQSKLRPIVSPHRREVTDEEVRLAKALLPKQEQEYYKKAGALDEKSTGGRFGANPKGDALPTNHGPLKQQTADEANNRLELLTRVYLEHGGRDLFTGQKLPITLSDLEHGIAESHAGRAAEQGLNYSPLKTSLNVGRGSKDHVDYYNSVLSKYSFDSNGKLTPASRKKVEDEYAKKMAGGALKSQVVSQARAARTAADLREISNKINQIPDEKTQAKLYNKMVATFLSNYGNVKVAETARAALQSHGRAEQAWYWYGDKIAGGGAAAKAIANKMTSLLENGNTAGAQQLVNIMANASSRIKSQVNNTVTPNTEKNGKPAIILGGDKTREVTAAVLNARDQILQDIEAL